MRALLIGICAFIGLGNIYAQSQKLATIKYDIVRTFNGTNIRENEQTKAKGAGSMPDVNTENRTFYLKDTLAYYKRTAAAGPMLNKFGSGFKLPFEEITFIDMKNSKEIVGLTILKEPKNEYYYSIEPLARSTQWKDSNKTKKILGYTCTIASVTTPFGVYTVYYTKDAGFTFSPLPGILPSKGLVLKIEGVDLSYTATKFDKTVQDIKPFGLIYKGLIITKEELQAKRRRSGGNLKPARKQANQN